MNVARRPAVVAWPQQRHAAEPAYAPPELAVVVPTFNERDNIEELLRRLSVTLAGIRWEVVFVDDDSRDGTSELLAALTRSAPHVRHLLRIGRRGLASACIEGMLASSAPFIAVMDADLQHDETVLPAMLAELRRVADLDVVVGTRFAPGGSTGDFTASRLCMSRVASLLSRAVLRARLSDPMSGFFMVRREFLRETARDLSGHGYKILLDLFASARREVRFAEVPYRFRMRQRGESKVSMLTVLEYIWLLADKLIGRHVPIRFAIFVLVGFLGVFVHLAVLGLFHRGLDTGFLVAQGLATVAAMTVNFNLNNVVTYRDRRLRGFDLVRGHLSFYLVCSVGAVANLQVAQMLFDLHAPWPLAGLMGAVIGSVWNYAVSSTFTWRRRA
ncbi:MAG TPA: glycosyltransferase family 2 protein [Geminicoccaceae bacterium]|nr:glycosyltransferase family 2 protein [Geminicoccaceae bacterium]